MLCGLPQYDVKDWEKNTQYPSGRGGHHATTIRNFCTKPPPPLSCPYRPPCFGPSNIEPCWQDGIGNHRRLKCHPRMAAENSCLVGG